MGCLLDPATAGKESKSNAWEGVSVTVIGLESFPTGILGRGLNGSSTFSSGNGVLTDGRIGLVGRFTAESIRGWTLGEFSFANELSLDPRNVPVDRPASEAKFCTDELVDFDELELTRSLVERVAGVAVVREGGGISVTRLVLRMRLLRSRKCSLVRIIRKYPWVIPNISRCWLLWS